MMKKTIIFPLILFLLAFSISAELTHYYKIELNYDNEEISYTSISVQPSEKKLETNGFTHIAEILSAEDKAINITLFGFPLTRISHSINPETGLIESEQTTYFNQSKTTLYLPYYPNAQQINIYDLNLNKKLTIQVSSFALEDAESNIRINEPEESEIIQKPVKKVLLPILLVLIAIAIITVLLVLKKTNH